MSGKTTKEAAGLACPFSAGENCVAEECMAWRFHQYKTPGRIEIEFIPTDPTDAEWETAIGQLRDQRTPLNRPDNVPAHWPWLPAKFDKHGDWNDGGFWHEPDQEYEERCAELEADHKGWCQLIEGKT